MGLKAGAAGRYRDIMLCMAQLVVRNLEADVKAELQRRARRHGRSTEEEVREILRNAVKRSPPRRLGSRLAARFEGLGLTDDIPELRGQAARPAELDA
jgi:plasmid stability protein